MADYKNYIFDFGNVLVHYVPEWIARPYLPDEAERAQVSAVVFDRLYCDKLDAGTLTEKQAREAFRARLPEHLYEKACAVQAHWVENMPPIEGMKELVQAIKARGGKLYLLSNISVEFTERYEAVPHIKEVLALFDGLVFSGPIRMVKPKKEIFHHLLERFDLRAEDCIFIDDSPMNIQGAKECGIAGYLFDGDAEKLRKYLKI